MRQFAVPGSSGPLHVRRGCAFPRGAEGVAEYHPASLRALRLLWANWPIPALARIKGTWMGRLDLSKFLPPPNMIDQDCKPHNDFPAPLRKPVEELFDAVLYLGPQDLRLGEKVPADIVLDSDYMKERRRRSALPGSPMATTLQASDGLDRQIF